MCNLCNLSDVQKFIIVAGVVILSCQFLYVPWLDTLNRDGSLIDRPAGYHIIFQAPAPYAYQWGTRIDVTRMVIPMVLVAGLTVLGVLFCPPPPWEKKPARADQK